MLWMTTPIERDARLLRSALKMGDAAGVSVLIEIVCTRPFADFLAIKYLYGKLFKSDLLFDLDQHVPGKAVRVCSSSKYLCFYSAFIKLRWLEKYFVFWNSV